MPQLFTQASLAAQAGVDPWALRDLLTSGDPAEIITLAQAFYTAAGEVDDAAATQARAQQYVADGYVVDGSSPIDASAQATAFRDGMGASSAALDSIAGLLVTISDSLAASTATAVDQVVVLEGTLSAVVADLNARIARLPAEDVAANRPAMEDSAVSTAVQAVEDTGGAVQTVVDGYEHLLADSLRRLADLGYIPPDALDEGPGDLDPSAADGAADAATTLEALTAPDAATGLAQYDAATQYVDLLNRRYAATGQLSDAEFAYLSAYYDATAPHFGEIDAWLQSGPVRDALALPPSLPLAEQDAARTAAVETRAAVLADGLLHLSAAAEQTDDAGDPRAGYDDRGRPASGFAALPASVREILTSDIGEHLPSPQTPDAPDAPLLLRASWVDGHWVVANLERNSGFTALLDHASPDVTGGDAFSRQLAQSAVSWKQDLNAVQLNTENWLSGAHRADVTVFYSDEPGATGFSDRAVAFGFPPDLDPEHLDLGLSDAGSSDGLSVAARNPAVVASLLAGEHDGGDFRHAVIGLDWQDGEGAGDLIVAGTTPGVPGSDRAALAVVQDVGSDSLSLASTVNGSVATALTVVGVQRLEALSHAGEGVETSGINRVYPLAGGPVDGLELSDHDAANYLKFVALTGPERYGLLHAAALEQGAQWIAAYGSDGAHRASVLAGSVQAAGFSAAIDQASAAQSKDADAFVAAVRSEQEQASRHLLTTIGLQTVGAFIDVASLGAADNVGTVLDALGTVHGIVSDGVGDVQEATGEDPYEDAMSGVLEWGEFSVNGYRTSAGVDAGTTADQQWMATRAAGVTGAPDVVTAGLVDADGMPTRDSGGLAQPDGSRAPATESGSPVGPVPDDVDPRAVADQLLDATYGPYLGSWGDAGIDTVVAAPPTDRYTSWSDHEQLSAIRTGSNQVYEWRTDNILSGYLIDPVRVDSVLEDLKSEKPSWDAGRAR